MKQYLLIIFLIVPYAAFTQGTTDSIFNAANKQYTEDKYDNAIQLYQTIRSKGYESVELYYNIGNAYYKLKQYPKAILNYEKALSLDPANINVKYNLAKARIYIIDRIDEIPEFIIKRWSYRVITSISSNSWAIITIVVFLLSLALFLVYFLSMHLSIKKAAFYIGLLTVFFTVASFCFSYKAKSLMIKSNGAIIMTPTVTVKSTPSETGTNLFIVHEGTKVYVIGQLDSWYEIKLSDGKQGWLMKSDIEAI
jgi:tetratricopeptide (TPR) repeat protein